MGKIFPTVVAMHYINFHGEEVLGKKWKPFTASLNGVLRSEATDPGKHKLSENDFFFQTPLDGLNAWFRALEKAKVLWPEAAGAVPAQILLRSPGESINIPMGDSTAPIWCFLPPELPHITAQLINFLDDLDASQRELILLKPETTPGFFPLTLKGWPPLSGFSIFPNKTLPAAKGSQECFYCGMTAHKPANCPSKHLSPEIQALSIAGRTPVPQINKEYEHIFNDPASLENEIINGLNAGSLRQRRDLSIYCAFFDITRIYQLRYLLQLAFCEDSKWPGLQATKPLKSTSGNLLFLGLDCLRVGNYSQAETILDGIVKRNEADSFFARIGLAFTALERGDSQSLFQNIESARSRASNKTESLYTLLLLSRYNELFGNFNLAEKLADEALELSRYCLEAQYRRIQLDAAKRNDLTLATSILKLISRERLYFPIALMDAKINQAGNPVELALAGIYEWSLNNGTDQLRRIRSRCTDLINWMGEDDSALKPVLKGLVNLEDLSKTNSYLGFMDLASNAQRLEASIGNLVESKRKALKIKLKKVNQRCESNKDFWSGYPFKNLFQQFSMDLTIALSQLSRAQEIEKEKEIKAYCEAMILLSKANQHCESMENSKDKMLLIKDISELTKFFAARLMTAEITCFILWLLGIIAATILDRPEIFGEFQGIPSSIKSMSLVFLTMFLAPFFSVILAVRKGLSSSEVSKEKRI